MRLLSVEAKGIGVRQPAMCIQKAMAEQEISYYLHALHCLKPADGEAMPSIGVITSMSSSKKSL